MSDFIDRHVGQDVPIKPLPLEDTPFRLVEGVKELKDLAAKLRNATEFSVSTPALTRHFIFSLLLSS